jgi:hypothetical protein
MAPQRRKCRTNRRSQMQPDDTDRAVKDDGEFYVVLNSNYAPEKANAFLQRRCRPGLHAPSGYECVGSADMNTVTGKWHADVNAPYDEDTESDVTPLGEFDAQQAAIDALWEGRHQAYCKQPRY